MKIKTDGSRIVEVLMWLLIAYWTLCLFAFYGCRSVPVITRQESNTEIETIRDTIVQIPFKSDTFIIYLPVHDTIVKSLDPLSTSKLYINNGSGFANIVYKHDTISLRIDSALKSREVVKTIYDLKVVYKCNNKFHSFAEWFTILCILIIVIVVLARSFFKSL
jgi:hypothetical protein